MSLVLCSNPDSNSSFQAILPSLGFVYHGQHYQVGQPSMSTEILYQCLPEYVQEQVLNETLDHYRRARSLRYPNPVLTEQIKKLIY